MLTSISKAHQCHLLPWPRVVQIRQSDELSFELRVSNPGSFAGLKKVPQSTFWLAHSQGKTIAKPAHPWGSTRSVWWIKFKEEQLEMNYSHLLASNMLLEAHVEAA